MQKCKTGPKLTMIHGTNEAIVVFTLQLLISLLNIQGQARTVEEHFNGDVFIPNFMDLMEKHGRAGQWHNVTTEDGYILTVFRILPDPSACQLHDQKRVAFLQHGLEGAADFFILFGPTSSLAYTLSDAGYDVWLGNFRGNFYSKRHEFLLTDDARFWNFSMDELGLLDLPAMIDYVLDASGQTNLTYVCHSSGCTAALMLLSDRVDYNQKINLNVMLAPIALWKSPSRAVWLYTLPFRQAKLIVPSGAVEFLPRTILTQKILERICYQNDLAFELCFFLVDLIAGKNREQLDKDIISTFLKYYPAGGGSMKLFYHYVQHVDSGKFRHYDYETPTRNLEYYGQVEPPEYDLQKITAPSVVFWGPNDPLSTEQNVQLLIGKLRNSSMISQVVRQEKFNHIDFIVAKDAKKLIHDPLVQILMKVHGPQCQVD